MQLSANLERTTNMSAFDPELWDNMPITGANETEYTPLPEGWAEGVCTQAKVKAVNTKDGVRPVLGLLWQVVNPSAAMVEAAGKEDPLCRQDIWLDEANGVLLMGRNQNVQLGKAREVCKLNDPKKPFSFNQFVGQGPIKIKIETVTSKDGKKFSQVSELASL
jgi:hypothetical protein